MAEKQTRGGGMPLPARKPVAEITPTERVTMTPQVDVRAAVRGASPTQAKVNTARADVAEAVAAAARINANPPPKTEPDGPIQVVATRAGFYANGRRAEGDKFTIASKKHLGSWMKKI